MELKDGLIIGSDGAVYSADINFKKVSNVDNMLEEFAKHQIVTLPMMDDKTVVSGSGVTAITSRLLDTIVFKTAWKVVEKDGETWMCPEFISTEEANRTRPIMTYDWKLPAGFKALFSIVMHHNGEGRQAPQVQGSMLHFIDTDGNLYVPPIANVYNDGLLCTGSIEWDATSGLNPLVDSYIDNWSSNFWNADLLSDNDCWDWLIRIDPRDESTMVPSESVKETFETDPLVTITRLEEFEGDATDTGMFQRFIDPEDIASCITMLKKNVTALKGRV